MSGFLDRIRKAAGISGRDTTVLLLSLLLAFSIWLLHNLSQNYTQVVGVPVVAVSSLDGHASESANSSLVQARCRTTGFNLIRLNKASKGKPVKIEIKPENLHHKSGDMFYSTANDLNGYVQAIFGDVSRMEAFVSDTLFFRFPEESHKKVPVVPVYTISYKNQYMGVGDIRIVPDSVVVYGEPHHLANIDKAYTDAFSLNGLSAPVRGNVRLDRIKGVRLSTDNIEYSVDVERYVEIQDEMLISGRNVPSDRMLIIYPSTATVSFRCAFPVTGNPVEQTSFFIDYKDFTESSDGRCMPRVNSLPEGVFDYRIEPEVFECIESQR